jgi:hypothetical protein
VPNPSYLRELTLRCRALLEMASKPATIEQLRMWAAELEAQADEPGRGSVESEGIAPRQSD